MSRLFCWHYCGMADAAQLELNRFGEPHCADASACRRRQLDLAGREGVALVDRLWPIEDEVRWRLDEDRTAWAVAGCFYSPKMSVSFRDFADAFTTAARGRWEELRTAPPAGDDPAKETR